MEASEEATERKSDLPYESYGISTYFKMNIQIDYTWIEQISYNLKKW